MQIFISYDDDDEDFARDLSARLKGAGYDVWFAARRILPGDNWAMEVAQALESSDAMVVLLSPSSLASSRVRGDVSFAIGSLNYENRLIPVEVAKVPPGEIPWILGTMEPIWSGFENRERVVREIIDRLERARV